MSNRTVRTTFMPWKTITMDETEYQSLLRQGLIVPEPDEPATEPEPAPADPEPDTSLPAPAPRAGRGGKD